MTDEHAKKNFREALAVGGKSNSLGENPAVIKTVLEDKSRLHELYDCLFDEDSWVRMRAADALEKVCRIRPEWISEYVDRINTDLSASTQPSIRWHIAQIYKQVDLTPSQQERAIAWLVNQVSTADVDWIVSANSMDTLAYFTRKGSYSPADLVRVLHIQKSHKSNAVVKRAQKLLNEFS